MKSQLNQTEHTYTTYAASKIAEEYDGIDKKYTCLEDFEEELNESEQLVQKNILRLFLIEP